MHVVADRIRKVCNMNGYVRIMGRLFIAMEVTVSHQDA